MLENSTAGPQKVKQSCCVIQQFYSKLFSQKKWKNMLTPKLRHKCSQQHYWHWPKSRNNTKGPSDDEWINQMWYVHTIEYYWAIKARKYWYMLDGPWKYYAKWKKAVTKDPILCYPTDTKCPEKGHLHSQAVESWFPQAGKIMKEKLAQWFLWRVIKMF